MVSPPTTVDVSPDVVIKRPPPLIVYPVMAPPLGAGALHESLAEPLPLTTCRIGAAGTPAGTTWLDTGDAMLLPMRLTAVTVNE